jgi:peroxiredoxin
LTSLEKTTGVKELINSNTHNPSCFLPESRANFNKFQNTYRVDKIIILPVNALCYSAAWRKKLLGPELAAIKPLNNIEQLM